jgi:hypothetical protein
MGKRGPKPRGEYTGKTAIFSTRIRPDTKARLVAAAKAKGRSLSQELERRLRWTFTRDDEVIKYFGSPETEAVLQLIGATIQSVTRIKGTQIRGSSGLVWTSDPRLFDQATKAIAQVLELFRPPGEIVDPLVDVGGDQRGKLAALELIRQVQTADPTLPLATRSTRQHALAVLREGLGELAERPRPYGFTADEGRRLSQIARAFHPLRRRAEKDPKELTQGEHRELWRLWGEGQALLGRRQERVRSEDGVKPQAKRRAIK